MSPPRNCPTNAGPLHNSIEREAPHLAVAGQDDERRSRSRRRMDDPMVPILAALLDAGRDPAFERGSDLPRLAAANRCPEIVRRLV